MLDRRCFSQFGNQVARFCLLITLGVVAAILGQAQDAMLWNRLYVTNLGSATVSVIDLNERKVISTIPVGYGPTGMAVSPNLERVYVGNIWSGTISVIATQTNTVETTIPIPSWWGTAAPFGLAMTPDGNQIFVSNLSDGTIRVVSTKSNTVIATITEAYDWALRYIVMAPNGEYAYAIGTGDGKISVIRVSDYKVVAKILNLPAARHMAVTPDGSRMYVTSDKHHKLYVIDAANYSLIDTISFPTGSGTITVDIDPTGKFALVSNFLGQVSMVDINPQSPAYNQIIGRVPPVSFYQYCIAIAPDGKTAYLSNQADRGGSPNSINLIDIDPDSPTPNTIFASIPVGTQPWGIAIVKQSPPNLNQ